MRFAFYLHVKLRLHTCMCKLRFCGRSHDRDTLHGAARALHARSPQRATRPISAEGSSRARALRHARSPQRVRRARDALARRRSESASTSATAQPSQRVRQAQDTWARRRSKSASTRNVRRGSESASTRAIPAGISFVQRLQMSEALRLPRNSQTKFLQCCACHATHSISAKHTAPTTINACQSHRMLLWTLNPAVKAQSEDWRGATASVQVRRKVRFMRSCRTQTTFFV